MAIGDFKPISDYRDAFSISTDDLKHQTLDPPAFPPAAMAKLGDFDRLWEHLGKAVDIPPPAISSKTSVGSVASGSPSLESSPDPPGSTPPSSAPEHWTGHEDVKVKSRVRWTEQEHGNNKTDGQDLTPSKRQNIIRSLTGTEDLTGKPKKKQSPRKSAHQAGLSESEAELYRRPNPSHQSLFTLPPKILPSPDDLNPSVIKAKYNLTKLEQTQKLSKKLLKAFEPKSTAKSRRCTQSNDIHVFVDVSNIVISFYSSLKRSRGLDIKSYIKQPPFNFENLALILERGREAVRRVIVGSSVSYDRENKKTGYLADAAMCGYEINILERVLKAKSTAPAKKRLVGNGNGFASTSGHSSSSDTPHSTRKVMAEQGVDELLHMKMLESLVDSDTPATMVLATGDAAEAEYSPGFLKNVERALSQGWNVELVAWSQGLSQEYRTPAFQKRWAGKFKIIFLDEYLEELLALYAVQYP